MRPRSMMRPLLLSVTVALAAALAILFSLFSSSGPPHRVSATDFDTGNLQGTVYWKGTPVTGLRANDYGGTYVDNGTSTVYINHSTGTYSFANIAVGTYTPKFFSCCSVQLGQGSPTTVSAGQTATADIDLTGTAGEAVGLITVNGQPLSQPVIRISTIHSYYMGASGGNFAMLLPPGTYTADVYNSNQTSKIGSFPLSVTAGQTD